MSTNAYWWNGSTYKQGVNHWVWNGSTYKSVKKLFVWNGSAWKEFFSAVAPVTLNSASGVINSAFDWDLSYTLSGTGTGYTLDVQTTIGGLIALSIPDPAASDTVNLTTDSSISWDVILYDSVSVEVGRITVTPV